MAHYNMEQSDQDKNSTALPGTVTSEIPEQGLLQIIWRRRWIVLLAVVVALAAGLIYLAKATPVFTSTSQLYVEQSGPRIITEQEGVMTQSKNYLYTQAELIRSTSILALVVDDPLIAGLRTFDKVDNPLGFLKSRIQSQVGKKDDILSISLDSPYPAEAAQLVNRIVDGYITYHATQKKTTSVEILKILQKEKTKRESELAKKFETLLDFTREHGGLAFDDQGNNIVLQRLAQLSNALTEAQLQAINSKADYETVKMMVHDPDRIKQLVQAQRSTGVYVSLGDQESQLRSELKLYQGQLENLKRQITAVHPMYLSIKKQIAALENKIEAEKKQFAQDYLEITHQRWVTAQQREAEIMTSFEQQQELARDLQTNATEYAIIQSDVNRTERMCDIIDDRIKELNVTEDVGALNITILEVARVAEKPSKPQRSQIMAMALVLGLMLGVGLTLTLDWLDTRLRSADEISAILGVPVLGVVPHMTGAESYQVRGQKVNIEPTSPEAEAYKTIRTAIYFGVPEGKARTILVTSPAPNDGKTTLVSNLAITMAQAGQRTLIMDCDFRKPRQHEIMDVPQEPGLCNVLARQAQLTEVLQRTQIEGLDVLACGAIPVNPSEMLNSPLFNEIMEKLLQRYDRVVIDSPPVMPVTDARILGALSDVTLLVVQAKKSTRKSTQQARDGLLSVGSHLLGAVVNDVSRKSSRYGYYSGYGYYGYGYGQQRDRKKTKTSSPAVKINSIALEEKPVEANEKSLG